jgi:hypothetical protein
VALIYQFSMAYLLFKYIRRKVKERKEARAAHDTTDKFPLTPEHNIRDGPQLQRQHEALSGDGHHYTQPYFEKTTGAEMPGERQKFDAEAKRIRAYRWRMILGLLLPNFLASVDVTIVAPAIPTISSHFSMWTRPPKIRLS